MSLIDAGTRWRQSASMSDNKRNKKPTLNSTRVVQNGQQTVNSNDEGLTLTVLRKIS